MGWPFSVIPGAKSIIAFGTFAKSPSNSTWTSCAPPGARKCGSCDVLFARGTVVLFGRRATMLSRVCCWSNTGDPDGGQCSAAAQCPAIYAFCCTSRLDCLMGLQCCERGAGGWERLERPRARRHAARRTSSSARHPIQVRACRTRALASRCTAPLARASRRCARSPRCPGSHGVAVRTSPARCHGRLAGRAPGPAATAPRDGARRWET